MAEVLDEAQAAESEVADSKPARPTEWWWVEMWYDNRRLFIEIVKHILIFAVFAIILEVYHRSHKSSQLPLEETVWLNKIHFYGYIVLLVILVVCLIIKVGVIEVRGMRK